jgi:hypothetical protein
MSRAQLTYADFFNRSKLYNFWLRPSASWMAWRSEYCEAQEDSCGATQDRLRGYCTHPPEEVRASLVRMRHGVDLLFYPALRLSENLIEKQ